MKINDNISDSVASYTGDTYTSQIIKMLMNPVEYLKGLKHSKHFLVTKKIFTNEFEFNMYMKYLSDILVQGYYNYSHYPDCIHRLLYRVMGDSEIEKLRNSQDISLLMSTCKEYNPAVDYILDNYKEVGVCNHYIIELLIKGHIPYIDVDFDSRNSFEHGEIILLPKLQLSSLDISPETYVYKTVFHGKATVEYVDKYEDINLDEIAYLYNEIIKCIWGYSHRIGRYLNNKTGDDIFDDDFVSEYIVRYVYLVNMYIKKKVIEEKCTDIDLSKVNVKRI